MQSSTFMNCVDQCLTSKHFVTYCPTCLSFQVARNGIDYACPPSNEIIILCWNCTKVPLDFADIGSSETYRASRSSA